MKKKYEKGSSKYPGCKDGEVFLALVIDVTDAYTLGYKRVRIGIGDDGYDYEGNIMPEWYPVFVSKTDYDAS